MTVLCEHINYLGLTTVGPFYFPTLVVKTKLNIK